MPALPESMMNQTIYTDLIKVLPSKIIIDVAQEVRAILALVDGEAETVIAPLIRSINQSKFHDPLIRWAQDACTPPVKYVNAHNADEFFLLDSLGEKIFTQLHRHGMYVNGKLPYQLDEIMTDGSVILSRVDSYADYEHQAAVQSQHGGIHASTEITPDDPDEDPEDE